MQGKAGGEYRRNNSSEYGPNGGGHLIGVRFGGSTDFENLVAQNQNVSRSEYYTLENNWAYISEYGRLFFYLSFNMNIKMTELST